jgi:hypothetical protein
VTSFLQPIFYVCLVAVALTQLSIYFSHAVHLALYGRWSGRGLSFRQWIPKTSQITSFSLHMPQGAFERGNPFFSLFGFFVCGFFGLKETIGYSSIQNRMFFNLWKRSSVILTGG